METLFPFICHFNSAVADSGSADSGTPANSTRCSCVQLVLRVLKWFLVWVQGKVFHLSQIFIFCTVCRAESLSSIHIENFFNSFSVLGLFIVRRFSPFAM